MIPDSAALPRPRLRDSTLLRLALLGALVLALLVPLAMVRSLVREREQRWRSVASEIAALWGREQRLGGPLLTVPYEVRTVDDKGQTHTCLRTLTLLPERLAVRGRLEPERRRRGIFETVVYRARLEISGSFLRPQPERDGVAESDLRWSEARLSVGIPDLRGAGADLDLDWGGRRIPFSPGSAELRLWPSGLSAAISDLAAARPEVPIPFAFDLTLTGSERISFLPFGKETVVELAAPWASPSFDGAFLPESREVTPAGFQARWRLSHFARSYPQQWLSEEAESVAAANRVAASAFGVALYLPADAYQKSERSAKYGILFLLLTFLTYYLFEIFHPVVLHPVQYLLVGAALCLFYLLLLSPAEQMGFALAYGLAALATIGLIGGYSAAILRARGRATVLAGVLAVLYSYLYVLLQAEDYALLMGTIGLFTVLALTMFFTRRIDWARGRPAAPLAPMAPAAPLVQGETGC